MLKRITVFGFLFISFVGICFLNPQNSFTDPYDDITDFMAKERFHEAETLCKKMLKTHPDDVVFMAQMGGIYWAQEKKFPAITCFRKALKIDPDYPVPYFFLGKIYFKENKPEKGKEQFKLFEGGMEPLLDKDEKMIDYYVSRLHEICYLYSTRKWYKEIKVICRKIIRLRSNDAKAYYNLAVCYYVGSNNRSRAYNELMKVKELEPDSRMSDKADFYIDYMRRNPDSRILGDFTFLYED